MYKEQLCYFKDIDYQQEVDYINKIINKKKIKDFLIEIATEKIGN